MSSEPKMLYLPPTMANWPWPRAINKHYAEVKVESDNWIRGFNAFTPKGQYAFFKGDFPRIASLVYPKVSKEHLRTGCDLMNMFFVIDEYTDVESEQVSRSMVDPIIDALHNPHKPRPEGEINLGEIARQFWSLAIKTATPTSQKHFIETFTGYLEAVVEQARDRDDDVYRSIESYFEVRRKNVGARPSFVPLELGLDLPDEVFYHPVIDELSGYITDLIILDNDLASYNKEQAVGDDRLNIVTLAMREFNTNVEGAMNFLLARHTETEKKFLDGLKRIPSWGPDIDWQVQQYVDGLGNWARGNDCWNFECGRYFGGKGPEIQKTRWVPFLKKVTPPSQDEALRRENVVIPLVEELEASA